MHWAGVLPITACRWLKTGRHDGNSHHRRSEANMEDLIMCLGHVSVLTLMYIYIQYTFTFVDFWMGFTNTMMLTEAPACHHSLGPQPILQILCSLVESSCRWAVVRFLVHFNSVFNIITPVKLNGTFSSQTLGTTLLQTDHRQFGLAFTPSPLYF